MPNKTEKPGVNAWDYYVSQKFSIFPVKPNKRPAVTEWKPFQEGRPGLAKIEQWKKSNYGIAIATGKLSNLTVIDADTPEAIAELEAANRGKVQIPQVITPTGGRHYYCRYSSELPANDACRGKCKKIDVRSEGGYVVAPPTRAKYEKPEGNPIVGTYKWDEKFNPSLIPIPNVPAQWIYLLHPLAKTAGEFEAAGERLVDGRRDVDLFHMAWTFRKDGYPREQVEEIILDLAKKCKPPFSAADAKRKVKSAFERPLKAKIGEVIDPSIPMSFKMSDVLEEEMVWLWRNYIPSESITLISGDPNAGKSWWATDMACKVSRGGAWPDGAPGNDPKNVYYMTYEDSLTKHLKKRIRMLGGDGRKIIAYNSKHPIYLTLSTPEGLERLENELIRVQVTNGGLLITDPILDFTGDCNPNAVEIVRALLTPIAAMAERLKISILMIGHLNKDQMKSAMYRAGGSTGGWMGKSRAAFLIARSPEDRKRYVVPIKFNYAWPEPVQMEFEIRDGGLLYELTDVDINEVLNPKTGRRPERSEAAIAWLDNFFEGRDEVPSTEIEAAAARDGISFRTLKRIKSGAGYKSRRLFGDSVDVGVDRWVWKKS